MPYGAVLYKKDGDKVKKGDLICDWDAYNATTIVEVAGTVRFENMIEGSTFQKDAADEFSISTDKVIIESKDKTKSPALHIVNEKGESVKTFNLPVGAHVMAENGSAVKVGDVIMKIPRAIGKASDITGGLPRVTELFEARNPSNPAILSEINGEVLMGKVKRGNREIVVQNKSGAKKTYLVPMTKQILVQENDYVKAGTPLSDGGVSPSDILSILGPVKAAVTFDVRRSGCFRKTVAARGHLNGRGPRSGRDGAKRKFCGATAPPGCYTLERTSRR